MLRIALLLILLAGTLLGQLPPFSSWPGGASINSYTVATLPAAPATGTIATVTDGSTLANGCTVGGGSVVIACRYNGSAWAAWGDGNSGGTPAWSALAAPTGAVSMISDATAETATFDFRSAFTTGPQMLVLSSTGNPTGGILMEIRGHDADVTPWKATGDGTNGVQLSAAGSLGAIGTGAIVATSGDSATAFFTAGQIEAARGGTAADSSAATGVAYVTAGSWAWSNTLPNAVQDLITRLSTITVGVWNGTDIAVADGGTGASTAQGAINAISGLTTNGDLLYHNGTNSTRLARGTNGQCLTSNATTLVWGACGSSSPGGADTQVQFNDGGVFGGDDGLTYNKTTNVLTVLGGINSGDGTVAGSLTLTETTGNGSNFRKFSIPDALTADLDFRYPNTVPAATSVMTWAAESGGQTVGAFATVSTLAVGTAAALAANGGNCAGNNFALGVDAAGVAECAQPSFANLSGSASLSQLPSGPKLRTFGVTIDGGGSAITTGVKGYTRVPFACTISKVSLLADQTGSLVIDVWKDTYANYPPTVADTITASAKPTLSSAIKAEDATLTGWTTSVTAGDTLGFNVDSATTVTRAHLIVECTL